MSNNETLVPYKAALDHYKCPAMKHEMKHYVLEAPLDSHMASEIPFLTDAMLGTSCDCRTLTGGPEEEEEEVVGFATHSASDGTT
jgi:hypothetical protein